MRVTERVGASLDAARRFIARPSVLRSGAGRGRDWLSLGEMLLLALLAVQLARLVWAIVTPVGAFGAWTGRQAVIAPMAARQALFAAYDPFFPGTAAAQGGNAVVTSLSITLFGTRVNEGSGQGSAIIATPDGVQQSFAVGEEIMPGVILKSVHFDHVTIDRGGTEETVFIDQSQAAPIADPAAGGQGGAVPAAPPPPGASQAPAAITAQAVKADIGLAPRMDGGRVTGLVLQSKGPAFQAAGFRPGDIVTEVNGRRIGSAGDIQTLQGQIVPGARLSLTVERGAAVVPIALILQGQ
ncbi:type II secretion system protein N [Sphingobium aquiterrae]|uniref:type II secretion system protein N n=1 Tax=Sphingobium aquiterrae TaxID=2038656 RepID=UPI00301A4F9F